MKKKTVKTVAAVFSLILAVLLSFSFVTGTAGKAEAAGEEYAIVVSEKASSTEMFAAETLQEYLYALNKTVYEIITDNQPFDGFKFCVGATSLYDTAADIEGKPADSYVIAPFTGGLAIFGAGGRGTLYGVHTFLEDYCGFKCICRSINAGEGWIGWGLHIQ